MKTTTRLLLADIAMMWRQGLAISLLLACGVSTWIMTTSTMRSMQISRERYYREYHFADVFLELTRAPVALAERFRDIPGVVRVDTRVVRHVIL
ncbi:MAG: ABC transporter permease, partial [Aureliella sp.]